MSNKMAIISCQTEEEISSQLLKQIQKCVDNNKSDLFICGLSGGSLPNVLVKVLPKVTTDWTKWRFLFCDERIVPFEDKESTFGVYERTLLSQFPDIKVNQFLRINQSLEPKNMAKDYENRMRALFGSVDWPKCDLLLLGMGPDGHTCSLFPNHEILKETAVWVAYIADSPKVCEKLYFCSNNVVQPPDKRITLTLPVLNNAKCCLFYATGAPKAQILKEILVEKKGLPAGLVKPIDGRVVWILDEKSSELIPKEMFE